jgi:hypothetical protein
MEIARYGKLQELPGKQRPRPGRHNLRMFRFGPPPTSPRGRLPKSNAQSPGGLKPERARSRACGWLVFLAAAAVTICAMHYVANRCKSLRHFPCASSSLRVALLSVANLRRPVRLEQRTQRLRCRTLNATARSRPHCRQRHRRSRWSIRTLSDVSRWPLPQWSGTWMEALLQRQSTLENGTIAVLLVGITPPLPN